LTVTKPTLEYTLPPAALGQLIPEFEAAFQLPNAVVIWDEGGQHYFGPDWSDHLPGCQESLFVDKQVIGTVGLWLEHCDPSSAAALRFLANSLSLLASETWRRALMTDEVVARYDELNLIYELGMQFAQGTGQDEIVRFVLMETNRIIQADAGVIYVWDPAQSSITPGAHFGRKANPEFLSGRLRELALSTLYAYDQAQLFDGDRVICAPLRFNDELLGSLVLVYEQEAKRFRANDVNLLTTLMQNTALFIYVARLVEKLAFEKTQLEKALAELQAAKDKLSQSERLSVVGQTVSSLVHDMRKPLSNVMGYAGLLQEPDLTHEERYQFAGQIIKYVNVFSAMAQEVLDYVAGDSAVNKQPITVEEFMSYVGDLLNPPGLTRDVKIFVDSESAHHYTINVDKQRFTRVFQNLVNNAVDAIEQHGGSQVEIIARPVGKRIEFVVRDDGPGVPEKILQTLFQPFVTFGKSNGTGLGLAIVDRMVRAHGGEIRYETVPGGGACFSFAIPQYPN
jgi:signal transduction histidine kinase